jgi:hypothetical protein
MKNIITITFTTATLACFLQKVQDASTLVAARNTRTACVYLTKLDGQPDFCIEGINRTPSLTEPLRFGINAFEVRWSQSRQDYVMTINNFIADEDGLYDLIRESHAFGMAKGLALYEKIEAEKELRSQVNARIIGRMSTPDTEAAYFQTDTDARAWLLTQVTGEVEQDFEYIARCIGSLVDRICTEFERKGGSSLTGLYKAWFTKPTTEDTESN